MWCVYIFLNFHCGYYYLLTLVTKKTRTNIHFMQISFRMYWNKLTSVLKVKNKRLCSRLFLVVFFTYISHSVSSYQGFYFFTFNSENCKTNARNLTRAKRAVCRADYQKAMQRIRAKPNALKCEYLDITKRIFNIF